MVMNIDEYPENERNLYCISVGIRNEDYLKLYEIYKYTPRNVILFVLMSQMDICQINRFLSKGIRKLIHHCILIAGNVVTREMTEELIINGKVDIVKVGIGSELYLHQHVFKQVLVCLNSCDNGMC